MTGFWFLVSGKRGADRSARETGGAPAVGRANGAGSFSARRQRPGNGSRDGNAALKVRFSPGSGRFQNRPEIKNPGLRRFTSAGQAARPPYQAGLPGLLSLQERETRNPKPVPTIPGFSSSSAADQFPVGFRDALDSAAIVLRGKGRKRQSEENPSVFLVSLFPPAGGKDLW